MDGIKYLGDFFSEFFKNFFGETLRNIGVKDVIDILLLSFVLFFIYNLIRDSRAWRLIIGLVVMALYKPRTWCSFCPMGTMTQMICKLKAKEKL